MRMTDALVSDEEVDAILPKEGFIRLYVDHAAKNTKAPKIYHLGMALSLLSVTSPPGLGFGYASDYLRPNLYVLIVGRSGDDMKSTALNIGKRVLHVAGLSDLTGPKAGSREAFMDSVIEKPRQIVFFSEFGDLLAQASQPAMAGMKTFMTDVWDCTPVERRLVKMTKRVDDPRLSIAAACSLPFLYRYTSFEDWNGGFMGRWLIMFGRRTEHDAFALMNDDAVPLLAEYLKNRSNQIGCTGRQWSRDAATYWRAWFEDFMDRPVAGGSHVAGFRTRAVTYALKVAMIYASTLIGDITTKDDWIMPLQAVEFGISIAETYVRSVEGVSANVAIHEEGMPRLMVLTSISEAPDQELKLGELLTRTQYKKRTVESVLEGLMEEGLVVRKMSKSPTYVLSRVGEEHVRGLDISLAELRV